MHKLLCLILLSSSLGLPAQAQEEAETVIHAEGVVEALDLTFPQPAPTEEEATENAPVTEGQVVWARDFLRAGSTSVQLQLQDRGSVAGASGWIEIRDGRGDLIERIDAARLVAEGDIWTSLAFGPFIEVLVVGATGADLAFSVAAISYDKSGARVESIIGQDGRQHIIEYDGDFAAVLPTVEGAVAKLTFIKEKDGFPARFVCTGFMIAKDLLLTNEHCVATEEVCKTTKVLFGLSINKFGVAQPKEQVRCLSVEKSSFGLDFALLRLEGNPGERWGTLALADRKPTSDEKIYIVQHPAGEPKQISDEDCTVAGFPVRGREPKSDLSHSCDTLGGSSGSPVFDAAGEVIGLHHLGKQSQGIFAELNRAVLSTEVIDALAP